MAARTKERLEFLLYVLDASMAGGTETWGEIELIGKSDPDTFLYSAYRIQCGRAGFLDCDEYHECTLSTKENPIDLCPGHDCDADTVAKGLGMLLATGNPLEIRDDWLKTIREANRDNDAGDCDASISSAIVETALFGKPTYI